jgi:hypothetical protein
MDPYIYALSATINNLTLSLSTVNQGLSSIPSNPYLATKFMLFGKDYKFPTIDDVHVPEEITTEGLIAKLEEIQKQYQCRVIDCLANPSDYHLNLTNPTEAANRLSILAELSGENTYVVTQDKFKNYIEFLEIVESIDDSQMTEETCNDTIKKIGYYYTNLLAKKTI